MSCFSWNFSSHRRADTGLSHVVRVSNHIQNKLYKEKTGVGCDGFHRKVLLDLAKETREIIVKFMEKVEQSGIWPQQACTTMFILVPKNVTSEIPIARMPTLIRWWEALRAPEVAK